MSGVTRGRRELAAVAVLLAGCAGPGSAPEPTAASIDVGALARLLDETAQVRVWARG